MTYWYAYRVINSWGVCVVFFPIPFIIMALLFLSRLLLVVTQIRGHIADSSPPLPPHDTHYGSCLPFFLEKTSAL